MKQEPLFFRSLACVGRVISCAAEFWMRSFVCVLIGLGVSQFAHSSITIQSYWQLGEGAAIGTDSASGTANPLNNTTGTTILTATPSSAAGSTAYAHTSGINYQGIWMFGGTTTAQTVPADNWGVQFNVRVTTLPTTGTYKAVFGMAEGVSGGLVIEANNVGGTVYFDVNKQGTANYIIPRNAAVTVTANTWYNLALVKNGGTTYFYVNGALVGSNAGAINTSGLLGFGFEQNVGTHQLSADFDEARFFTFASGAFTTSDLSMTKRVVAYSGNGNTGGTAPTDSVGYFPGTSVTVLGAGTLTKTGYVFSGWNTQANGGGTSYSAAATFNIADADTTLYAQWVAATATISAASTFPGAVNTTYGTASGATSVAVSGVNLVGDITATAPSNLEVSNDNTTFGSTATFTQVGGSASGTLYVRITQNAPVSASPLNSKVVVLASSGATPVNVATTASGNLVAAKNLTVASATAQDKLADGTTAGTVVGMLQTAQAFGSGSSSDGIPYIGDALTVSAVGTFSSSSVGGPYTVTAGTFVLGGSAADNYALTQPTGLSLSASILNTATWTQLPGGTWSNSGNWLNGAIGTGANNTADFSMLNLSATTTVLLTGPQTIGGLIFGDSTPDNNWVLSGSTLTLSATSTPTIQVNNQTTTISSVLVSASGISKTGPGVLTLSANTSGATSLTANHGTLKLAVSGLAYNNSGGVGNGGTLTANPGATLQIAAGYNIGCNQAVNINGGTLDIANNSTGDGQNYTLNLNFTGGGSIISSTASSLRWGELGNATITVNGTTPATISSILRMIPGNSRTGTINVVDAAGNLDFTGNIIDYPAVPGGVPLNKTGAGTLTLAGVNTYTSTTTVNGGTLLINGSLATSTAAVTVQAGAIVSGAGTISRPLLVSGSLLGTLTINGLTTIHSGGVVSPGSNTIATLNINNTLELEAGSTTRMQIDKTGGFITNDLLFVNAINYHGTLEVTATGEELLPGDSIKLVDSLAFSGGFASYTLPTLAAGYSWDVSKLTVDGTIFVVDTLSTPVFNLASGGYIGAQTVTISDNSEGATIYYEFTTDGSVPAAPTLASQHGTVGAGIATLNVAVDSQMSIKAYAVKTGWTDSPVVSADYVTVSVPVWTMNGSGNWSGVGNWLHGAIGVGAGVTADFNTLTLGGNNTVTLDSSHTLGSLVLGDVGNTYGWILNASGGSALTLDNGLTTPIITVANQTTTVNLPIAGSHGLTKLGDGILILDGTNTFTGDVAVKAGALTVGSASALPVAGNVAITGAIVNVGSTADQLNWYKFVSSTTIGVGGVLNLNGSATEIHHLTLAGGNLTGSVPHSNYGSWGFNTPTSVEPILVTGGVTSTISAQKFDSAWANALTFNVDAGSTLDVTGTIGGNAGHSAFPLVKNGAGIMILGGANTYDGATSINGGKLVVDGTLAATAVTVANGATLDTGSNISGKVAMGASVSITSGGHLAIHIASNATNQITRTLTGNLTLSGGNLVDLTAASAPVDGIYTLISAASISGTPGVGTILTLASGRTATLSVAGGTSLILTVTSAGYDSWTSQITNGKTLRTDDADDDGFTNLQEFLFGTNPMASTGPLTSTTSSAGVLTIRWRERLSGAGYQLLESATLDNPWNLSVITPINDGPVDGDYQPRKAEITIGAGKNFFRVEGIEN